MSEMFDIGPLSWVKDEIDQSLDHVVNHYQEVTKHPNNHETLRYALTHLYQVNGALDMVGLDGCKRYCSEIERVTAKLAAGEIAVDKSCMDALVLAVKTLSQYLQDLLNGAHNTPLRLLDSLTSVAKLHGEQIEPTELFFPDISVVGVPSAIGSVQIAEDLMPHYIGEQRNLFQKAFLKWLKTNDLDCLADMKNALVNVVKAQKKKTHQSMWWAATAFVDALMQKSIAQDSGAKKLGRKLDQQLRFIAQGETKISSELFRSLLYYVALSEPESEDIRQVKTAFSLDDLLLTHSGVATQTTPVTEAERAAVKQLLSEMPVLKDLWVSVSENVGQQNIDQQIPLEELQGVSIKLQFLLEHMQSFGINQENPHNQDIIALLDATQKVAQKLTGEFDQLNAAAVLEVAAGLSLLEYMAERYESLDTDNHRTLLDQVARLEHIAASKVDELPTDISVSAIDDSAVEAVAVQIIEALRVAEKSIDGFFRNTVNTIGLDEAVKPLTQVAAAFDMLEMPTPKTIAKLSLLYIEQFKVNAPQYAEPHPNTDLFNIFAEGLSLLGLFAKDLPEVSAQSRHALSECLSHLEQGMDAFLHASEPAHLTQATDREVDASEADVDAGFDADAENRQASDNQVPPVIASEQSDELPAQAFVEIPRFNFDEVTESAIDEELKNIFIEEAQELLENNLVNLQVLRQNDTNQVALVEVRRSFHTLKGSGRTVGLEMMGDVAHALEKLLNILIEHKASPSEEILNFTDQVNEAFLAWIATLKQQQSVTLNGGQYQQAAADLSEELELKFLSEKPKAQKEEVLIGGSRKVGRAFFYLFLGEAQSHIKTLTHAKAAIKVDSTNKPTSTSRRAAHTLSSNALTAGFDAIGDLARALENWLDEFAGAWTENHLDLFGRVVHALKEGLEKVKNLQHPKAERALIMELSKSTASMQVLAAQLSGELDADAHYDLSAKSAVELSDYEMLGSALSEDELTVKIAKAADNDRLFEQPPAPMLKMMEDIPTLDLSDVEYTGEEGFERDYTQAQYTLEPPILPHYDVASLEAPSAPILKQSNKVLDTRDYTYHLSPPPVLETQVTKQDTSDFEAATLAEAPEAIVAEEAVNDLQSPALAPAHEEEVAQQIEHAIVQAYVAPDVSNLSDIDTELLGLFIEEASELLPEIGGNLRLWKALPAQKVHADGLLRDLHTLKGSARTAGQVEIGDRVHELEDRIVRIAKQQPSLTDFDAMYIEFDRISFMLEALIAAFAKIDQQAPSVIDAVNLDLPADVNEVNAQITEDNHKDKADTSSVELTSPFLRVKASMLDNLINEAGEVSILRSRMDRELQGIKQSSVDLSLSINRLRTYLQELEIEGDAKVQSRMVGMSESQSTFDPLELDRFTRLQELTRLMAESLNDVTIIQQGLSTHIDEAASALQQQNRMNREVQKGLMTVRMMPFSSIGERLQRIVRQISRELNKRVELVIQGGEIELDRSVLDKVGAPLEHVLRNAVVHGLEPPQVRESLGKPLIGQIHLGVSVENDEITLTISDDGSGINLDKVKAVATEKGLIAHDQAINDENLIAVIFESGFSTEKTVSKIAGRGVGLDAVRSDIAALNGRIDLSNRPGAGTTFNIYLPVSLSVTQVVVVKVGHQQFAIPSVMVEQVQTLKQQEVLSVFESKTLHREGVDYPLSFLGALVGDQSYIAQTQTYTPIVLLKSGQYRAALHVDEVVGNQEIVMKSMGTQLTRVPGIAGATVMGDGAIVFVINPVQLAHRAALNAGMIQINNVPAVVEVNKKIALVVDDSLTMRKAISRVLERQGFEVFTANDGVDAVQKLADLQPDIILTDIEMPRMDGFEFTKHVRETTSQTVPIIMISSRTANKHQQMAKGIGVNAFLGKPVQDEALINALNDVLNQTVIIDS